MNSKKLERIIIRKYDIKVETGLHIGGVKDGVKIGGSDNPVIKTLMHTKNEKDEYNSIEVPYVPGSSIKGKMKSLLLSVYGELVDTKSIKFKEEKYSLFFGEAANENDTSQSVSSYRTRAIFRDSFPVDRWLDINNSDKLTEIKGENTINPINGKANPRFIERVIRDVVFEFEVLLNIYDGDKEEEFKGILDEGIMLLESSYLGGNGSRGYGKIKFENRKEQIIEVKELKRENQ
ncbi:MAG: type III-A CRISPR-associated RAMP protein Csm3 [Cuniculiplasma sp.]